MPSGVVPHHQPCMLVCCLTIGYPFWRGASLSTMPIGVLSHYRSCLLVWCLIINHACWCGFSLKTMPVGVVPYYMPCLLVNCHCNQHFTSRLQTEEGWLKICATCTEVSLYQTCLIIRCRSQICLLVRCNYYQTCMLGS